MGEILWKKYKKKLNNWMGFRLSFKIQQKKSGLNHSMDGLFFKKNMRNFRESKIHVYHAYF